METHEQIIWQNSGSDRRVKRHWGGNRQKARGVHFGRPFLADFHLMLARLRLAPSMDFGNAESLNLGSSFTQW
jgi:hypothetical protein